jgi:hypothetical protein
MSVNIRLQIPSLLLIQRTLGKDILKNLPYHTVVKVRRRKEEKEEEKNTFYQ